MDRTRSSRRRRAGRFPTTSIRALIEQYPKEWLAIDVTAEQEGRPITGELVYHAKDREKVWQKTRSRRRLYIVYAGPALKEGYAAAF